MRLAPILIFLSVSCAGPTSPFGAYSFGGPQKQGEQGPLWSQYPLLNSGVHNRGVKIVLGPDRMTFHRQTDFKITIKDPKGIGSQAVIELFWNGENLSDLLESSFESEHRGDEIIFSLKDLRLIAERENEIYVSYRRSNYAPALVQKYLPPACPWRERKGIKDASDFKRKTKILKLIEYLSLNNGVNPNFVAGLVAQESSFNPRAVSIAKAMGLTQITNLAEAHVIREYPSWPQYAGVEDLSYLKLKTLVLLGEINKSNEWRLNKNLSILGGIKYLEFVEKYWKGSSHSQIMDKAMVDDPDKFSDVLLASYNSGPYRVKKSMLKLGKKWLGARDLKEARKYVKRVKSYCHHFSNENAINKRGRL